MSAAVDIYKFLNMDSKSVYIDSFLANLEKKFDLIFDAIDLPNVTLYQAIEAVKQIDIRIDPTLVQTIIQKKLDFIFTDPQCDACGRRLWKKYSVSREAITTIGDLTIECPYFYCPTCKTYHSPYEDILQLQQGPFQQDVQKIAGLFASKDTFEESAELLKEVYRFDISADTVHTLTQSLADGIELTEIIPTAEEVATLVDAISAGQHRRPVFVFAMDGAMAPIRGSEEDDADTCWKEVKGVRGYLLDNEHIVHIFSWHQIEKKADFIEYLREIKDKDIIPRDKVRLCAIGDGADWIWDAIKEIFPECREVLDYYHCKQHLYDFAKVHFANDQTRIDQWVEQTKVRLFYNNVKHVVAGLKRMQCRDEETSKSRDRLVEYLTKHKERTDYGKLRRGGYPLGSGAIESANKFICHVRLKRSGAWWRIDYANNILKLRCAKYNGKFDQIVGKRDETHRGNRVAHGVKLRRIK